ncbi:MAG TPA: ABC transporter substrate-binding protein [Bradyrhizobium sp.]|nr:ABC transporter substrate-binding protein [Bradyrhizobium sp.]
MNRREFIGLAGAACVSVMPFAARAQRSVPARVGFLGGSSSPAGQALFSCFISELRKFGWTEDRDFKLEVRWTEGVVDRYSQYAAELVQLNPDVIVATSTPGAKAAQRATTRIPVVFVAVSDPVASGIVDNLARPGGNITGVSNFLPSTSAKLIELLRTAAPDVTRFCVLHNPENAGKMLELQQLKIGGQALGVIVEPIEVRSTDDLERLLSNGSHFNCDALITLQEAISFAYRKRIADFAAQKRLPTIFQIREYVEAGGLMSYGLNFCKHYGRAAYYVDRVLKGTAPNDLPIELPTTFELIINSTAAKSLGLALPLTLLARADEMIE